MNQKLKETGNPAKIRKLNRNAILSYVRDSQTSSRAELVKVLKLAPATVTAVVNDLLEDKLLLEIEPDLTLGPKRSRGRPQRVVCLNPKAAYSLGLSLRVEHDILYVDSCYSDYCGKVTFGKSFECQPPLNLNRVVKTLIKALDQIKQSLSKSANITSVGISIPGVVTDESVLFAPSLPLLEGSLFYEKLAAYVNLPVYLENDASLLMVRELERYEKLRSINVSYLLISQGLGAGTALAGQLWKANSWSGEIGHVDIPFEGGQLKRLEWIIGLDGYFAKKMIALGIDIDSDIPIPEELLAKKGVIELLKLYTSYLFLAVQVLNSAYGLDTVIIGTSHRSVLDQCIPYLNQLVEESPLTVQIIFKSKTKFAAAEGASLLALEYSLESLHVAT